MIKKNKSASNCNNKLQSHLGKTFINDQSTTILQSANTTYNFKERVQANSQAHDSACRSYQCCRSSQNSELKFKPKIEELPYSIYPQRWQHNLKSKREQWQQLTEDKRSRYMQRTERKLMQEQQYLKQITFSPQISNFNLGLQNKQNVHQKLYNEAAQRKSSQLLKQKLISEKQQNEIQKYRCQKAVTDKYKILNKQKFDLNPLYLRLQQVLQQKKKNKRMIAERQKIQYPFQPQINSTSKDILANKQAVSNVVDRLIGEYKKKQQKMSILKDKYEKQQNKQLTFKPAINNYLPISNHKTKIKENTIQYNFVPQMNSLSSLMTRDRNYETQDQKLFRLHQAPIIKKIDNLQIIQDQAYAECVFNPEINQISKIMNTNHPKLHVCPNKECQSPTHRPKINIVSQYMTEAKRAKSLDNTKKKLKQKADIYKKQVEYQQMKECSFKPKIKDNKIQRKNISSHMSIQNINGFKKYFETKQKAVERQRKRKQLQQKLFHLEKSYDLRMSRTAKKEASLQPNNY